MKAFEIQTYQDGKWKIDSVFDDRDLALFEARRVDEGSRYAGVRVIEEVYDEVSDMTTTRTIFRGGVADRRERARQAAEKYNANRAGQGNAEREPRRRAKRAPPPKSSSILVPVLILTLLVVAGLTALLGLQHLSRLQ